MKVHYGFECLPTIREAVITMGSFDGLHRGHRLLIDELCRVARQRAGESVLLTFDPHPREIIHPDRTHRKLSTLGEKLFLLSETEVDHVVVIHFTPELMRTSSADFISKYLIAKLNPRTMITGQGHFFGKDKGGDVRMLREKGIQVIDLERFDNISSTMIRDLLEQGNMAQAGELLGGSYLVELPLERGSSKILPRTDLPYDIEYVHTKERQTQSLQTVIESSYSGFIRIRAK